MPPVDSYRSDAEAIKEFAALAQKAAGKIYFDTISPPESSVGLPDAIPVAAQDGATPKILPLRDEFERWRLRPERARGTATATTLASFIDLVNLHKVRDSALFAKTTWPVPALTAVIDYHAPNNRDGADNGDHRVRYEFPLTDEFKAWVERNGKPFAQDEFAFFIEERIADLEAVAPPAGDDYEKLFRTKFALPTEMVELSRGLRVHVEERVANAFMMQSGESEISFSSEHKGADGKPLHVPGLFMLCLPIFLDGALVRIPARLRYRVKDGALTWTYHLYRWEFWLRQRVQSDFSVAVQQTGLPAFEGAPERP